MNAPSFSSFPPSFGSFPVLEPDNNKASSSKQQQRVDDPRRTHTKHRARDPDRHKEKQDKDGRRRKDADRLKGSRRKHSYRDDERAKQEEDRDMRLGARYDGGAPGLFVVDKVGDPMNIVYGGIHTGDVPKYRRGGSGNILGLGQAFKIVTRGTGGKSLEIGINGRRPAVRYTDARSFALLTTSRTRYLLPGSSDPKGKHKPSDLEVGSQVDYIRLPSRRGRPADEPLSTYRSIHATKDADANSDSDGSSSSPDERGVSTSESDTDDTAPRTAHQRLLAELEAALQKDPTSLPTWIALLNQTLITVPPSAKSSLARARAEIKLSVLDRAMRTHRLNKSSVDLRVQWLSAGAEVWDAEKLMKEWESAVTELGGQRHDGEESDARNRMWDEWLRWRVSSAGNGVRGAASVEGIVEDAARVLKNVEGELAKVKAFWRVAVVLKAAGFSERAMALFQSQAELTFNRPPSLASGPLTTQLDALEEFWEADARRIGETEARGWDAWEREGRRKSPPFAPTPTSSLRESSSMDVDVARDPYTRWAADEARADADSNMPKRGNDAGEDPYATILFSDLRPLLVELTTPKAKRALRIAWLESLGLHVPGFAASLSENSPSAGRDDVWSHAHLARTPLLGRLFPSQNKGKERGWDAYGGTIVAREKTYGSPFGCVKEWGLGVFAPLEGWSDGEGRMWEAMDVEGVDMGFVRRVFEQLRQKVVVPNEDEDEEWDVMAVAFEATTSLKNAGKVSRTLLSSSRDSLPLWGAHARLQRMRGKLDEARRIYDTALSVAPTPIKRAGEATLWWDWAEMEWLSGEDDRARGVVLRASGSDPAARGAMSILRAKRALEDRIHSRECPGGWKEREGWACLWALWEVLAGGTGAVEEGIAVLEDYVRDLALEGVARESAWTRMLLMGWKHANLLGRQIKRGAVREKVLDVVKSVESCGQTDTAILGVFLAGEKGESVWGRVRALIGEEGGTTGEKGLTFGRREKGVVRRVWEVWLAWWEKGRWEAEVERVRNSLEIGVREERTRASAILWRVYVEFEIHCGELKRGKALLFRAVSECPLVKDLYLLAFGSLRSTFTAQELEGWAETMAERGIRLHRGLDEYVGMGGQEESSLSESEEEGEDELEREARDYRRLAPY